jgi:hypothetical protein
MLHPSVASPWALEKARLAAAFAALAVGLGVARGAAPGRDLGSLAVALGRAAGGARVRAADLRWELSGGALPDAAMGRWVLFLAGDDTRDLWRARVRVSPEGSVIAVDDAHDLTGTPLGDDHALVIRGPYAAFATRAYGQEQSMTVLDLSGEGAQNKTTALGDRAMAAITNLQRTGSAAGIGRVDVLLESSPRALALAMGDDALEITLFVGDARRAPTVADARFDLVRGEIVPPAPGLRADASMHLPKRVSHWAVDTLRAVRWIGPAPIAWLEDQALSARDAYRRLTFQSGGATDVVAAAAPPPPSLDTSEASVEEAHWPPPRIPTIWKSPEQGEGEWAAPNLPWLRRVPGVTADAPSAFLVSYVRPDEDRPYAKVLLVEMDMRQLDLDMEAGVEDPEPLTGPPGTGRIPRDPAIYRRVAAAFNGAFKTEHGHYGMMVHKRVLLPPLPGAATVVVLDDGRVGFGSWGTERKGPGIVGVSDDDVASFRQNLVPLVDHGRVNPTGRNLWGFTLPGKGAQTERSGLCVTTGGHLLYAWGDDVSATTLAKAMTMAGCDYALHLDMNPYHTGFLFTAIDDLGGKKYKSQLLTSAMSIPTDRYIQYAPKDFFYAMVHDPTPAAVDGAAPWRADGGTQPSPGWMPGLWSAHVDIARQGSVELLDVEPGRSTWRIRAGSKDAPASVAPLRELGGDEAKRVLFALGMGIANERRPLGLATDGRLAVAARGGADAGLLIVGADGGLRVERADDDAPVLGAHDDMAELPIVLWDGDVIPSLRGASGSEAMGATALRAALGVTATGRILVARGSVPSAVPLAQALARAGCVRALSLDRGLHASALLDRAGTASPPRASYEESVLYAIGTPLRPRGFVFPSR